ncbi:hypothetical protein RB195_017347 [Necator americanus]|uniref:Uncharacterized protein n=1 Tax=Necator americanus TaxID=51031 RepID=A0ABR1C7B0_NECAM
MSISKRDQKTHHFRPILKSSRHTSLQHCQQLKPLIKRLFVGCVAVTEDNLQTYLLRHDNRTCIKKRIALGFSLQSFMHV